MTIVISKFPRTGTENFIFNILNRIFRNSYHDKIIIDINKLKVHAPECILVEMFQDRNDIVNIDYSEISDVHPLVLQDLESYQLDGKWSPFLQEKVGTSKLPVNLWEKSLKYLCMDDYRPDYRIKVFGIYKDDLFEEQRYHFDFKADGVVKVMVENIYANSRMCDVKLDTNNLTDIYNYLKEFHENYKISYNRLDIKKILQYIDANRGNPDFNVYNIVSDL